MRRPRRASGGCARARVRAQFLGQSEGLGSRAKGPSSLQDGRGADRPGKRPDLVTVCVCVVMEGETRACLVNTQLRGQRRMAGARSGEGEQVCRSSGLGRVESPEKPKLDESGVFIDFVVVLWASKVIVGLFTVPLALYCRQGTTCMSGA
jgi:hypothetical protein